MMICLINSKGEMSAMKKILTVVAVVVLIAVFAVMMINGGVTEHIEDTNGA